MDLDDRMAKNGDAASLAEMEADSFSNIGDTVEPKLDAITPQHEQMVEPHLPSPLTSSLPNGIQPYVHGDVGHQHYEYMPLLAHPLDQLRGAEGREPSHAHVRQTDVDAQAEEAPAAPPRRCRRPGLKPTGRHRPAGLRGDPHGQELAGA